MDCDFRSIELIKKRKINLNIENLARQKNAKNYMFLFPHALKMKFGKSTLCKMSKEIYDMFPPKIDLDFRLNEKDERKYLKKFMEMNDKQILKYGERL
jgi:hypothetical protein